MYVSGKVKILNFRTLRRDRPFFADLTSMGDRNTSFVPDNNDDDDGGDETMTSPFFGPSDPVKICETGLPCAAFPLGSGCAKF